MYNPSKNVFFAIFSYKQKENNLLNKRANNETTKLLYNQVKFSINQY